MPERYVESILKFLSSREYQPLKPRQLARQMGVAEEDYGTFREAVKRLRDGGRVVLGARDALTLPAMGSTVVGTYRANPRGFGFVVPETPNSHGDLYIPGGSDGGAMTGDEVVARVLKRGRRDGEMRCQGEVVQIIQRAMNRFVGTLQQSDGTWFMLPDGNTLTTPVVLPDVGAAGPKAGTKVVVEIVKYPAPGQLPTGVIVETLGPKGDIEVETRAVIRAHGLSEEFPPGALADARAAVDAFDGDDAAGREDLSDWTIVTIDPPDARDFDDAISLARNHDGTMTLGVHIADVSHFVREGGELDAEARRRGTSVYFARKVLPMLPEVLSNGVCSLQADQRRYAKSAFITYDARARVVGAAFAETVIRSSRRMTYTEAQAIIDGKADAGSPKIAALLRDMADLARRIEARRQAAGMLHLELPAVELVFDENERVVDAVPEDDSYTHTVIEMLMVEANEAVARLLDSKGRAFLRRIHPDPDSTSAQPLAAFVRACGQKLPVSLSRTDIQRLLEAVKGRPEEYAVNLAVLRTFQQAEYSPRTIGHFALASSCYCHFTSPIRRYPDLTVHRLFAAYCRGTLDARPPEDVAALTELGANCSAAERRAESAERELREVLVLQFLATKVGESFEGVITGVANFGLFVQSPRYLIEGLIRMPDLGDDWWEVDAKRGEVRGEHSGRRFRIGDRIAVRIAGVDPARRRLDLAPQRLGEKPRPPAPRPAQAKAKPKSQAKAKAAQPRPKGGKRRPRRRRK